MSPPEAIARELAAYDTGRTAAPLASGSVRGEQPGRHTPQFLNRANDERELAGIIDYGKETRNVEFKSPGARTDRHFLARVVRAVLAMSNLAGGGTVVLGVRDKPAFDPVGLSLDQCNTWTYDDTAAAIAEYADPFVTFSVEALSLNEKTFVVIEVAEFEELPVICKRPYEGVLTRGVLYVRPRGKIQSVPVPDHAHMREVVERAMRMQLHRFLSTAHDAGMVGPAADDARPFDEQVQAALGAAATAKIRSSGFWQFSIRPTKWLADHVPYDRLTEGVHGLQLRVGGWVFPPLHHDRDPARRADHVEEVVDAGAHQECWRMHQSGLFLFFAGFLSDWCDGSLTVLPDGLPGNRLFAVTDSVRRVVTFMRFSSALALSSLGASDVELEIAAVGIQNRGIWFEDPLREMGLITRPTTQAPEFRMSWTLAQSALPARSDELALEFLEGLFSRFGWKNTTVLRGLVDEVSGYIGR